MVAKAKLTLERLASVENSRSSDVTVSKLKQNSALSSQLPESTNYKVINPRKFLYFYSNYFFRLIITNQRTKTNF